MTNLADADDRIRYDERDLLVLHYACTKCPAKRSLYVEPTTSTSRPAVIAYDLARARDQRERSAAMRARRRVQLRLADVRVLAR